MRSWFIDGEFSGSKALIFPAALASSKGGGFSSAGVGAGQGRVDGARRAAHAPETPDGSLRIKLTYSVTVGVSSSHLAKRHKRMIRKSINC
jgi:hypothetical protein